MDETWIYHNDFKLKQEQYSDVRTTAKKVMHQVLGMHKRFYRVEPITLNITVLFWINWTKRLRLAKKKIIFHQDEAPSQLLATPTSSENWNKSFVGSVFDLLKKLF